MKFFGALQAVRATVVLAPVLSFIFGMRDLGDGTPQKRTQS